jgi:hypothetical protein
LTITIDQNGKMSCYKDGIESVEGFNQLNNISDAPELDKIKVIIGSAKTSDIYKDNDLMHSEEKIQDYVERKEGRLDFMLDEPDIDIESTGIVENMMKFIEEM